DIIDVNKERRRLATRECAQLVNREMPRAKSFADKYKMLEFCLSSIPADKQGHFCEFGVAGGQSINFIAGKTGRTVHGFDSFEGLPETWREGFEKGTFKQDNLPAVKPNVRLHKGWFNESLPVWKKNHEGPVLFLHMDADIYSSTK